MNDPRQWTEQDLQFLVMNKEQESLNLDYKASEALGISDGKKVEISKDVSSFANSADGTIVYGVDEDEEHFPTTIRGCDPLAISKEWLDQVITSRIQPRPSGVIVNQIALSQSDPGHVVYVVVVPQAVTSAHQAADKRFYKRFNDRSVPMEEYEIRDVYNRSVSPDLRVSAMFESGSQATLTFVDQEEFSNPVKVALTVENKSPQPAEYAIFELFFEKPIKVISSGDFKPPQTVRLLLSEKLIEGSKVDRNHNIPANLPIFEGVIWSIVSNPVFIAIPAGVQRLCVVCAVHSPKMRPCEFIYLLTSDGQRAELRKLDEAEPTAIPALV